MNLMGSQDGGTVDSLFIEISRDVRWNETLREKWCFGFSRAVEIFVNRFYNVSQCNGYVDNNGVGNDGMTTTVMELLTSTEEAKSSMANTRAEESGPVASNVGQFALIVTVYCVYWL